jgi:myo-inositol catabolism protein IolS
MIYKKIPGFSFDIPVITFGGASISGEGGGYGFGSISEKDAEALLKSAWEAGITLFDTAPIYGFGLSEERMGRYLPKEAKLISKSGVDWHDNKRVNMTNDPGVTEKMLNLGLKRINRDFFDIYMIHWPDPKVDIRIPLDVLIKAQERGKIKKIGLCNTTASDLAKAKSITQIDVLQSELNFFNQAPFAHLGDEWKGPLSMSWGTFDKGILSGRVTKDRTFDKEDARSWAPWWNKKEVALKIEKTQILKNILSDYNISLPDFCLSYNLQYFGVTTCLIGLKTVGDVVQMTSSLHKQLMREKIEEVLERFNILD